ncbi:MAG TPA: P-loop NTPase [Thermoanaerobaculaceae bacterium]|nr:P-loop NTPase [Thermoanaerobaculaceae bacterium]
MTTRPAQEAPGPQAPSTSSAASTADGGGAAGGPRRIIAVGGGKGGSGKSLVSTSLGLGVARRERRAILVDCDLGGANLHSLLGMDYPRATLSDFILRRAERLEDLVVATPVPGLGLISGARNAVQVANPLHQQKLRLMRAVQRLAAEVVILDLGAGTNFNVVDFFLLADFGVLVIVPEPTSVENAYRFLKAAFLRRVKAVAGAGGFRDLVEEAVRSRGQRPLTPAELAAELTARDPAAGAALERELAGFRPLLLVNQVREAKDLALQDGMVAAARRLFGLELVSLGHLPYDDHVWRAVRAHQALSFEQLGAPFAGELDGVVGRLLELPVTTARASL